MFTEAEAKTKWCPFARTGTHRRVGDIQMGGSGNRNAEGELLAAAKCLASGCMAWRQRFRGDEEVPSKGYCGLAGTVP